MVSDVFDKVQAAQLLQNRRIWFIGCSNMRAIYKDIIWLVTKGTIAPDYVFKTKNEVSYLGDERLTNDKLHNGLNYIENREFKWNQIHLYFHFITRLYLDHFVELIEGITEETCPHVILINSSLWDLGRWGQKGSNDFRKNLKATFDLFKSKLPAGTRVIWNTSLPISISATGAIFMNADRNQVNLLPWHIMESNKYAASCCNEYNYDILDFHYYTRMLGHLRVKDGIHWSPPVIRYLTNIFLTHLTLCVNAELPGRVAISDEFVEQTSRPLVKKNCGIVKKLIKTIEKLPDKVKKFNKDLREKLKSKIHKRRGKKYRNNVVSKKFDGANNGYYYYGNNAFCTSYLPHTVWEMVINCCHNNNYNHHSVSYRSGYSRCPW